MMRNSIEQLYISFSTASYAALNNSVIVLVDKIWKIGAVALIKSFVLWVFFGEWNTGY